MERGRGLRLTKDRVLLLLAVVVLVLLAFASTLGEVEMGSETGGAARDWIALLIVPLALAGVGYVYTSYETRRTRAIEQTRAEEARLSTFLDEMNDLIFDRGLRASQPGADVRRVADEADLSGANVSGAEVTRQQLDRARSLAGTVMLDGSTHP